MYINNIILYIVYIGSYPSFMRHIYEVDRAGI